MPNETKVAAFLSAGDDGEIVVWSDEQLLRQFVAHTGESAEAAFATLTERHGPLVHRVCLDVLRSAEESRDAAQAVFLVLARKAGSIRKPGSLGPWLHGVALRVARRARIEATRRRAAEREKAEIVRRNRAVGTGRGPMDYAELHEEIARLPEKYRRPIILCYLRGRTQAQAAESLGWPLGTVQVRLHRGRARLRARLARRGAGLMGMTLSAFLSPPHATAAPGPRWVEATARAAVRSAARGDVTGLVAPGVSGLAGWALKVMLIDSLKAVGFLASGLLVAALGLWSSSGPHAAMPSDRGPAAAAARRPLQEPAVGHARPAVAVVLAENNAVPARAGGDAAGSAAPSRDAMPLRDASIERTIPVLLASLSPAPVTPRPDATSRGRELFERSWVKNDPRGHGGDGLGPVFNGRSCVECHNLGGSGGAGGVERNIEIATVTEGLAAGGYGYAFQMDFGAGQFQYQFGFPQASSSGQGRLAPGLLVSIHPGFATSRSVVLHRYGTDSAYHTWRESLAGVHGPALVRISERNPPPLFGAGRIDAIPDSVIEAAARRKGPGLSQVKGRVSRLRDGRVGRFGWKAQTATLEEFVHSAAAGEMGLEVPGRPQAADPRLPGIASPGLDMDEADCNALVDHVRRLLAPVSVRPEGEEDSAQVESGEAVFKSIGCAACHIPRLGDVEGIYSDLLLHDMGPAPGGGDGYSVFVGGPRREDGPAAPGRSSRAAAASAPEWRTPPLWGLRDSAPYMHDGHAATVDRAVALHGGQGAAAARRYADLSPRRRRQVEAFLISLAAPQ
jgi:RNA polymerase sigma factor (sigma-70 family)